MPGGVADDDSARAVVDGCRVESFHHLGIAAAGVLGHIHDFEAEAGGKLYGFFCGLEEEVVGPTFGVAANGAGANESGGFDIEAGALRDFRDRTNVVFVSASGTVGANFQSL